MKLFKLLSLISLILLLAFSAFSQQRFSGRVVEVTDGRTVVVEIGGGGRITVVLQYVEVPEPEQPLAGVIREHLEKLLLNRVVRVDPKGIAGSRTTAQVFFNGLDISQQLLRDGAAWYAVPEMSGQNQDESIVYQQLEAQAREEKRGVWSIRDLPPAWEFRAAKAEELRIRQAEEEQRRIQEARARDQ